MPEAATVAIEWLITEGIITEATAAAIGEFVATYGTAAQVIGSVYVMREQQRRAQGRARDAYNNSLRDRYAMVRGATEPRRFVLGRQRVSGPVAFIQSTGADRTTLAFVVLCAAHEADGFEGFYIEDELAEVDGSGNVLSVRRRDVFSIAAASATVELTSEPAAGTVTATATYGTTVVPLTVSSVSGTSVTVTGALVGSTGTLTITYQPASSPWVSGQSGAEVTQAFTLDASGNGSVTLTAAPIAGSVHAVASSVVGDGGWSDVDLMSYASIAGLTLTVSGATAAAGYAAKVTYRRAADTSRMVLRTFNGSLGQVADAQLQALFPGTWTSDHTVTGQAGFIGIAEYDTDAFPNGMPNISVVMRGAKLYDPRTGATAWSENPALMCRYVATHPLLGRQLDGAVNDDNIAAQANACDPTVTYLVDGQAHTRPLYTAGLVVQAGQRPADILNDLCNAMAGRWCVVDGMLRLRAGAAVTPLQTLDETWLIGEVDGQALPVDLQPEIPRADAFNIATGKYADASRDFAELDYPAVSSASYIEDDDGELPTEISLPAVTFGGQAQQVVAALMRDSRLGLRLTVHCKPMQAYPVEPFDVLYVTLGRFGFDRVLMEVLDVQWTVGAGIQLMLKATHPSIWALGTDFESTPIAPPTRLPSPWYVPAVDSLACHSGAGEYLLQADGTVVGTMRVTWTPITDRYVTEAGGGVEVKYGLASESETAWRTALAPQDTGQVRLADVQDGRMYLVKARAYTAMVRGEWSPVVLHQVVAKVAAPDAPGGLVVTPLPGGVLLAWDAPTDPDYLDTEVRVGASWGAGASVYQGYATRFVWPWPSSGTYTLRVKHRNRSMVPSAETTGSITVGTNVLISTTEIAANAATESAVDEYDFAGGSYGTVTARTVSFTPTADCTIEFTATLIAAGAYQDGGHDIWWEATPSGGSTLLLGNCQTQSTAKQLFAMASAFAAVGGVAITFALRSSKPSMDPANTLFMSRARIVAIKR